MEQKYVKRRRRLRKKIAIVVISLVRESVKEPSEEIEAEILEELEEVRVPWMERVEKVTVLESDDG